MNHLASSSSGSHSCEGAARQQNEDLFFREAAFVDSNEDEVSLKWTFGTKTSTTTFSDNIIIVYGNQIFGAVEHNNLLCQGWSLLPIAVDDSFQISIRIQVTREDGNLKAKVKKSHWERSPVTNEFIHVEDELEEILLFHQLDRTGVESTAIRLPGRLKLWISRRTSTTPLSLHPDTQVAHAPLHHDVHVRDENLLREVRSIETGNHYYEHTSGEEESLCETDAREYPERFTVSRGLSHTLDFNDGERSANPRETRLMTPSTEKKKRSYSDHEEMSSFDSSSSHGTFSSCPPSPQYEDTRDYHVYEKHTATSIDDSSCDCHGEKSLFNSGEGASTYRNDLNSIEDVPLKRQNQRTDPGFYTDSSSLSSSTKRIDCICLDGIPECSSIPSMNEKFNFLDANRDPNSSSCPRVSKDTSREHLDDCSESSSCPRTKAELVDALSNNVAGSYSSGRPRRQCIAPEKQSISFSNTPKEQEKRLVSKNRRRKLFECVSALDHCDLLVCDSLVDNDGKLMTSIIRGIDVVSVKWVKESLSSNKVLDRTLDRYRFQNEISLLKRNHSLESTVEKWNHMWSKNKPERLIFSGYVFVWKHSSDVRDFSFILELGGEIVDESSIASSSANPPSDNVIVICDDPAAPGTDLRERFPDARFRGINFLWKCITNFKMCD